eukprot:Hpha_TRINITY_DN21050_c0_g1::TRINITY_DN21050_c0_g1_i1::g.103471::m.103471
MNRWGIRLPDVATLQSAFESATGVPIDADAAKAPSGEHESHEGFEGGGTTAGDSPTAEPPPDRVPSPEREPPPPPGEEGSGADSGWLARLGNALENAVPGKAGGERGGVERRIKAQY